MKLNRTITQSTFVSIIFFTMTVSCFSASPQDGFAIKSNDRVVIYGDSITSRTLYPVLLETYFTTRFPKLHARFFERGWGGDKASNPKRFERDCLMLKPDVVLISLGMNDACYKQDISKYLRIYINSQTENIKRLRQQNPKVRIYLISPTLYEVQLSERRAYYPYVLWIYSRELRKLARKLNVGFIDLNREFSGTVGMAYAMFSNRKLFKDGIIISGIEPMNFSVEGIHPNLMGHVIMAVNILKGLGATDTLASAEIDAETGKVVSATGENINILKATPEKLSFERTLDALPFAIPEETESISFLECIAEDLNRDILKIKNLKGKFFTLSIDGQRIADFELAELSDGINLSEFTSSPDYQQAVPIIKMIEDKRKLDHDIWKKRVKNDPGMWPKGKKPVTPVDDSSLKNDYQQLEKFSSKIKQVAVPKKHRFDIAVTDRKVDRYQRFEKIVKVNIGNVTVKDFSGPVTENVDVALENLSNNEIKLFLHWVERNQEKFLKNLILKPHEKKQIKLSATINPSSPRPVLQVSYQPVNKSFPRIVSRFDVKLCPVLTIPKTGPIKIDGNLNEWKNAPVITVDGNNLIPGMVPRWNGNDDLSLTGSLMWDETYLYMTFTVNDQAQFQHYPQNMIWREDSIQIGVMMSEKAKNGRTIRKVYGNGLAISDGKPLFCNLFSKVKEHVAGAKIAVKRTDKQTIYEAACPWSSLQPFKPAPGKQFRFNFGANDADFGDDWKYISWTFGIWYGNNPKDYAIIILGDKR